MPGRLSRDHPGHSPAPADELHHVLFELHPILEWKAPWRLERRERAQAASAQPPKAATRQSRANSSTGRRPETSAAGNLSPGGDTGNHSRPAANRVGRPLTTGTKCQPVAVEYRPGLMVVAGEDLKRAGGVEGLHGVEQDDQHGSHASQSSRGRLWQQ
jgi:hypothetical protein